MGLIAIYGLPSRLCSDFDLNQCLAHSASMKHASDKAMMLLGLMWMVARWAWLCSKSALARCCSLPCSNGLFCCLGCGVSERYKKGERAFEKTTPCKGLFEKQSHAIPFFRLRVGQPFFCIAGLLCLPA